MDLPNRSPMRPLIIIGAPRSGTNMLRDVLTNLPGVSTWPCDEINYIWRHGNISYPSDEFPADKATPEVRQYIRQQFAWVANRYHANIIVEKTCANSLRVPFVDQVLPEARYLFIRRNGLDAVGSAVGRWKASLDIPYLARKVRFVPYTDLPYYAARYLRNRLHRFVSNEGRIALWGPQLDNIDQLLAERPLDEVCALQWRRCVEAAGGAFATMADDRWLGITYEDFVQNPNYELSRILDFCDFSANAYTRRAAVGKVRPGSIGKGAKSLGPESIERITPLIQGTMNALGYSTSGISLYE